jgi:hypothetical protein
MTEGKAGEERSERSRDHQPRNNSCLPVIAGGNWDPEDSTDWMGIGEETDNSETTAMAQRIRCESVVQGVVRSAIAMREK